MTVEGRATADGVARRPERDADVQLLPGRVHYWVDHACEFDENNGIQRVSRNLARSLKALGQPLVYRRWSDEKRRPTFCTRRKLRKFARWNGPQLDRRSAPYGPEWWLDRVHAARPGEWLLVPEVTYARTTELGGHEVRNVDLASAIIDDARSHGLRIAFVFHDLLPLEMPGDPLCALHEQYVSSIARADLILAISNHAAGALADHFRTRLNGLSRHAPIVTCRLADEYVGAARVTEISEPPEVPIEILCIGTLSPRKNQLTLLQAFDAFCREHPHSDARLSLIGNFYRPESDEIERAVKANPRTRLIGFRSDRDVIEMYRQAHFSVFPSIGEGFGLPIVESLWLGKPCLCANFGSMAELAAYGGCLTADMRSVDELKRALTPMIFDRSLRARLRMQAVTRPILTWRDYGASVLAACRRADVTGAVRA